MTENSVNARVRLLIDIPVNSTWGPTTTMAQITKQAEEDALAIVNGWFEKRYNRVTVIGKPVVTAILATGEKQ